ncbi:hypothetical protein C8Q70DRAFT_893470, partial [Cubamyces menziesii]
YHPAFSSPNADVVLLSVDSVRFRVPSELLSRSSAWFRTMLSLPQGPGMDRTEAIPVDEPSDVLADVLSIVNGSDLPALDQVDRLETLLAVADKYEMSMVTAVVRMALSSRLLDVSPIRLYGIACRMSWKREAMEASSRTLTTSLLSPAAQVELAALEPSQRDKLLDLHRRRREELFVALDNETTFYANVRAGPCNTGDANSTCTTPLDHSNWWALKYALLKRWDERPIGEELDESFYRMPEVWDMSAAKCLKCERKIYGMASTIENVNAAIRKLPRTVQVS